MTIRRKYSLPNCTLVLEGMSDGTVIPDSMGERPLLSILVNAECSFTGIEQTLHGGREFLENLAHAASAYSQEFLSGIYHPQEMNGHETRVRFERLYATHLHRLVYQPETEGNNTEKPAQAIALDLTTVQLFDLLEAVDQCLADNRTLPNLQLAIAPISRRYRKAEVPLLQRVAPAALGITALALAGVALFFVPIPEVREPEPVPIESEENVLPEEETPDGIEPEPLETLPSPSPVEEEDPSPQSENPESAVPSASASPLSAEEIETILASATEISDPTEVWFLQRNLYRNLNRAWENRGEVNKNLQYRVSVTRDGTIIQYEPIEGTPEAVNEVTPLTQLAYTPTRSGVANQDAHSLRARSAERIADYRVVFTEGGVLQVSPWKGLTGTPKLGKEITDPELIQQLNEELAGMLQDAWGSSPSFPVDLVYRVGVTEEGAIADYEPKNQPAVDYVQQTPLSDLWQPEAAGIGVGDNPSLVPQEPLAQYEVVFKPSGVLEVSPWRGV